MTYRVCFVCTGNICRSPMAESVFRARVEEAGLAQVVEIDSAGTGGWHEGRAPTRAPSRSSASTATAPRTPRAASSRPGSPTAIWWSLWTPDI